MTKAKALRRKLTYCLAAIVVIVAIGLFLFLNPAFVARLFFGVDSSPVELELAQSYSVPAADEKTETIVAAAALFLDSLNDEQRQEATFSFADNAQRSNWSNLPEGMVPRGGLKLGELSVDQRAKLDDFLMEIMSEDGARNIFYQMLAEDTLVQSDFSGSSKFGSKFFYTAFLGDVSTTEPWMFQFGGHHLAINVTIFGPHVSYSPMLTGGHPLHLDYDGEQLFLVQKETVAAQALMDSLTSSQKAMTVRGKKAINLLLGPGKYGISVPPEGIKGSQMTEVQKGLLRDVVAARLGFMNEDDYAAKMATVMAEIDDTYFGWWGPQGVLGTAYFRVTGPSVVLEYAPQGSDVPPNHAHSMYRNPKNDYGSAWIGVSE